MTLFPLVRQLCCILAFCGLILASPAACAEGSKELNGGGGNRVFLEWNPGAFLGGNLARRTRILVYAQVGETINLGSSISSSTDSKDIVYSSPSGAQAGICDVLAGGYGLINTLAKEKAGPLPNAGGYTPCVVTATETGVYAIEFHSGGTGDPSPQLATAEITGANQGASVAAWDVTVRSGAVAFTGRVFTPYLSVNMGNTGQSLSSNVYVQTRDGYQYRVDFNGVDPYGFILVANRTGITLNGKPTFQSLQLPSGSNGAGIPAGYAIGNEDVLDLNSFHKIYFNPPNPSLPTTAAAPGGSIWLHPPTALPGDINTVTFTGVDGTPGQFAPGMGGTFSYNALGAGTVQFALDLNNDGIYGNANDRVLFGTAELGANTLIWDGKDAQGVAAASTATIRVRAELAAGDVHFPYMDAETNTPGLIIERLTFPDANKYTVYWDDTSLDSSVATTFPRLGTQGTSSVGGAHRYPSGYGDNRVIDTWALYPSGRPLFQDLATPGIVDVSVTKTHSPAVLVPGQPVTYTITVTNTSTLARANGVKVTDTVPAAVTGVTWTCVGTGAAICAPASGSGNTINAVVNLPRSTSATYTVSGTLDSTYASSTLSNTANATRGNDTTDPTLSNNTATDLAPIDVADVGVVKTGFTAAAPLSDVTYTLVFTNNGPASATITPKDTFSNSTFVSASDSGTAAGGVVTWPTVTLTNGQSVTRTVVLKMPNPATSSNSLNTASFTSNKADLVATNNNSAVTTNVRPASGADMVVQKTGTALVRGQNSTFTLIPRNIGLAPTSGVITLTDPLQNGLMFVSGGDANWTCSAAGSTVTCVSTSGFSIPARTDGLPLTITVFTPLNAQNSIDNTASVKDGSGGETVTANNRGNTVTFPVSSLTDIQLTKTPTGTATLAGTNIVYTLTASNLGPSNAAGVTISDPLPSNVSYVSSSNSGVYDAAARTVTWTVGAVNVGTPVSRTVTVTPPLNGSVVNTASVTTSTPETKTGNNSATSTLTVTPVANLEIRKEGVANYGPLANLTYTLRVANFGPSRAENLTVTDPLPLGATYVSNTGGDVYDAATRTITWTAAALDVTGPNSNLTYTVTVLTPATGTLSNTASVSSIGNDPTPGNNTSTAATTIVPVADVQVSKTGPATVLPNGDITYTISVLNAGPSPATAVTVTDLLPSGITVQNTGGGTQTGNTIVWTLPLLASGATQTYTVVLGAPNTSGTVVNGSSASSPVSDPDLSNNNGTNPESQVMTTINVIADVQITKTAPPMVRGGTALSYTITVTNAGPADANGAALKDPAIPGFTATAIACTASGNATCPVSLSMGTLQAGTTIPVFPALGKLIITLSGTAANGGQIVNTATAKAPSTRTDPTLVNLTNTAVATTDTVNLTLSKTVQNISAGGSVSTTSSGKPGETLEYCVIYTNIGSAPLPNLTLSDPLPPNTEILPSAAYTPGSNIKFTRTPARTPTPDTLNPSNAADTDDGTLDTALSFKVGTAAPSETGTACFRVKVK
ncbi:DUF11 domain-containing protein [Deinococcus sp. Arct2-2]|uniref:DUF11 domain-containing protein n=1 Tax=Deinococcus sp. Arct2-2 TaxID=2568653 RepID=UPI001454C83B|nr:DUF11 domain-containing protein [Deinococcus sp. Arct2-2]